MIIDAIIIEAERSIANAAAMKYNCWLTNFYFQTAIGMYKSFVNTMMEMNNRTKRSEL